MTHGALLRQVPASFGSLIGWHMSPSPLGSSGSSGSSVMVVTRVVSSTSRLAWHYGGERSVETEGLRN